MLCLISPLVVCSSVTFPGIFLISIENHRVHMGRPGPRSPASLASCVQVDSCLTTLPTVLGLFPLEGVVEPIVDPKPEKMQDQSWPSCQIPLCAVISQDSCWPGSPGVGWVQLNFLHISSPLSYFLHSLISHFLRQDIHVRPLGSTSFGFGSSGTT